MPVSDSQTNGLRLERIAKRSERKQIDQFTIISEELNYKFDIELLSECSVNAQ